LHFALLTLNLPIIAHPNSKNPRIETDLLGTLHVYVRERPQDGKANQAIIESLANYFDCPKSSVTILRGHTAKQKTVKIEAKNLI